MITHVVHFHQFIHKNPLKMYYMYVVRKEKIGNHPASHFRFNLTRNHFIITKSIIEKLLNKWVDGEEKKYC